MHSYRVNSDPRAIIEDLRIKRGIKSARALAQLAGIKQPTLARYLNGTSATMETESFMALAITLEVTLSELLGEVPIGEHSKQLKELTAIYNELPDAQREALIAAGKAMVNSNKKRG